VLDERGEVYASASRSDVPYLRAAPEWALGDFPDELSGRSARHEALERSGIMTFGLLSTQGTGGQDVLEALEDGHRGGRVPHHGRRTAVRNLNRARVPESVAMKITGHLTRSVFDRYDITSEEDLAEASRKLQALTGTIAGTKAITDAEALQERLANSVKVKGLVWWRGTESNCRHYDFQSYALPTELPRPEA
jgi:hypothetical protein